MPYAIWNEKNLVNIALNDTERDACMVNKVNQTVETISSADFTALESQTIELYKDENNVTQKRTITYDSESEASETNWVQIYPDQNAFAGHRDAIVQRIKYFEEHNTDSYWTGYREAIENMTLPSEASFPMTTSFVDYCNANGITARDIRRIP